MAGFSRGFRSARRLAPVLVALYRRWEQLPPHEKERYKRLVREGGARGQRLAVQGADEARRRAAKTWERRPRRR